MSNWFYAENNEQKGPVNESELKDMLANKKLPSESLVWSEGMADWVPAHTLPNFTFRPPPMPAATSSPSASTSGSSAAKTEETPAPDSITESIENAFTEPSDFIPDQADVDKNKVMALLGYIIFFVPLLAAKDSKFARYHANQGLTLCLAFIGTSIVFGLLHMLPVIGFFFDMLHVLVWLGLVGLMIIGIINSWGGQAKPLPIIGKYTLLK